MKSPFSSQSLQELATSTADVVGGHVPQVAAALGVLVVGWLFALGAAKLARVVAQRAGIDQRLAHDSESTSTDVSRRLGRGVFFALMSVALVAFVHVLQVEAVTAPLNTFWNYVVQYAPSLMAGGAMVLIAWVVAKLLKTGVHKVLVAVDVDSRLAQKSGETEVDRTALAKTISDVVYWLVWFSFLPTVLNIFELPEVLAPVQSLVNGVMGYLPNIFAAAVILVVGWFVARVAQRVIASLSSAIGTDRLSDRLGLARMLGRGRMSDLLGLLVYILILFPVLIASLEALDIETVTMPATTMLSTIIASLPAVAASGLVMVLAYVIGKFAAGLATNLLTGIGFDQLPSKLGFRQVEEGGECTTPSQWVGRLIVIAFVVTAVLQALPMLGFESVAGVVSEMLDFAGVVAVGVMMLIIGLWVARLAGAAIRSSSVPQSGVLATLAQVAVLVFVGTMGLERMGLTGDIVNIAFGVTLGTIAVAAALAFGLGGRDAARQLLDNYVKPKRLTDEAA